MNMSLLIALQITTKDSGIILGTFRAKVESLNSTIISVLTKEPPIDELVLPRNDLNK